MLTGILAWLTQSWFGQVVSLVIGWFAARKAAQDAQNSAVNTALQQHEHDGAQSVSDQDSSDAQNAALDQLEKQVDNPTPVIVTPPKGN